MLDDGRAGEARELDESLSLFRLVAVHAEEGDLALFRAQDSDAVDEGNGTIRRALVVRRVDACLQNLSAREERAVEEGIIDRLPPRCALGVGHDRRDGVHQLG